MPGRGQQPPVVVLPVNFDESRAQRPQQRARYRDIVDESAAAAIALDRAPYDQRLARFDVDAVFGEQRIGDGIALEGRRHAGL